MRFFSVWCQRSSASARAGSAPSPTVKAKGGKPMRSRQALRCTHSAGWVISVLPRRCATTRPRSAPRRLRHRVYGHRLHSCRRGRWLRQGRPPASSASTRARYQRLQLHLPQRLKLGWIGSGRGERVDALEQCRTDNDCTKPVCASCNGRKVIAPPGGDVPDSSSMCPARKRLTFGHHCPRGCTSDWLIPVIRMMEGSGGPREMPRRARFP
jgi:hypothetical protein